MTDFLTRGLYAFVISVLMMSVAISCDSEDESAGDAAMEEHFDTDHDQVEPPMSDDQMSSDSTQFTTLASDTGTITVYQGGGTSNPVKIDLSEYTVTGYVQASVMSGGTTIPPGIPVWVTGVMPHQPGITQWPGTLPSQGITDQPVDVSGADEVEN